MTISPLQYFTSRKVGHSRYSPETLTRHLGIFLSTLEHKFGSRNRDFTILGIEILDEPGTSPHTWFPPSDPKCKHVIIHLSYGALKSFERARWQLAHECVHLLDPHVATLEPTSNLEEGLARWFQDNAVGTQFSDPNNNYAQAAKIVTKIIETAPNAIRELRVDKGQPLAHVQAADLAKLCQSLTKSEVEFLCARFK